MLTIKTIIYTLNRKITSLDEVVSLIETKSFWQIIFSWRTEKKFIGVGHIYKSGKQILIKPVTSSSLIYTPTRFYLQLSISKNDTKVLAKIKLSITEISKILATIFLIVIFNYLKPDYGNIFIGFVILLSLIDSVLVFKSFRKAESQLDGLLNRLEKSL